MIKFPRGFYDHQQDYILFEIPDELLDSLKTAKELEIREKDEELFILGEHHTYQLEKVDVSNSLMPTDHSEGDYNVLSITQTHLAPVSITPKIKNLFEFFKKSAISSLDDIFKPDLHLNFILDKFVISKLELIELCHKNDIIIKNDQIIFFKPNFLAKICEELITQIKDNYREFEEVGISLETIKDKLNPNLSDLMIEVCLNKVYKEVDENKGKFDFSFEKMIKFNFMTLQPAEYSFCLEEIYELLYESLKIVFPAKIFHSKERSEIRGIIGEVISQNALISDDINYGSNSGGRYNKKNCSVEKVDRNTLSEDPKKRIEEISAIQRNMSKREIIYWFKGLFQEDVAFEKFMKKYFLPIKVLISESMYPVFEKLYPHYLTQGLVNAHESDCMEDVFELKLFKIKKTWI